MTKSLRVEYDNDCFQQLCAFVRKNGGLPPLPALHAASKKIGAAVYRRYRVLNDHEIINITANKNANYVFAKYDPSKGRAPAKSTRAERNARDTEIAAHYQQNASVRATAESFKVSNSVVQRAIAKANIQSRRATQFENLPPCAAFLMGVLDETVSGQGVYCFRASQMNQYLKRLEDDDQHLNLAEIVELLNDSKIDASLAICDGDVLAFGKGRKYSFEMLQAAAVKITDINNNLRIHKFCQPHDPFRQREFRDGLGLLLYCFTQLGSHPYPEMIETLWLRSFSFADPERVRMVVRRALNTDKGMEAVENYARRRDDYRRVARAAKLTRSCCSLIENGRPRAAISRWLHGSELRNLLLPDELAVLDSLAEAPEPPAYAEFDEPMIRLLRSSIGKTAVKVEPDACVLPVIREPLFSPEPAYAFEHDTDHSVFCDEQEMRDALDRELGEELGPRGWADGEDADGEDIEDWV
jgi:hypothetical protein